MAKLVGDAKNELAKVELQTTQLRDKWTTSFGIKKNEYEKFLAQLGDEDVNKAQARLRRLKRHLGELAKLEEGLKQCAAEEAQMGQERKGLLGLLNAARLKRFQKRSAKAKEWELKLGSRVKINILGNGEINSYMAELIGFFRGSYLQEKDLRRMARSIAPERLVDAILNGRADWIEKQSGVAAAVAEKAVEFAKGQDLATLLDLETVPLSDLPEISFEVESGRVQAPQ